MMTNSIEVQKFIDSNLETWIKETVLDEAVRHSQAANMPRSFTANIKLLKRKIKHGSTTSNNMQSSKYQYRLENAWRQKGEDGKVRPLAKYFEYGTRDHWVAPRDKKAMAWRHPGHDNEHHAKAIFFEQEAKDKGDWIFSKGHYVSGLPSLMPMTRGHRIGMLRLRERIIEESRRFLKGEGKVK